MFTVHFCVHQNQIFMPKKFYLKERHNPQFKTPYYVQYGQLTKAEGFNVY